jgi:hypothetical protein
MPSAGPVSEQDRTGRTAVWATDDGVCAMPVDGDAQFDLADVQRRQDLVQPLNIVLRAPSRSRPPSWPRSAARRRSRRAPPTRARRPTMISFERARVIGRLQSSGCWLAQLRTCGRSLRAATSDRTMTSRSHPGTCVPS